MNHSILWNNVRFLKFTLTLTCLKFLILITGHIFLCIYFFVISEIFQFASGSVNLYFSYQDLLVITGVFLISGFSYLLVAHFSLHLREKEMFMRKWFGEDWRRIFWNLITEHILILITSIIIALVTFDLLAPAFKGFIIDKLTVVAIRKLSYIPILINSFFVLAMVLPRVLAFSKIDRKDVLRKIYL